MGGEWEVFIEHRADREIGALPRDVKLEAIDLIESLADNPFQPNAAALQKNNNVFKINFGNKCYRLIYKVNRKRRTVKVMRARLRGTAYRGLPNP